MDVTTLLYGYRPVRAEDRRRKALALRASYEIARALGSPLSVADFVHRAQELAGNRFGPAAQDAYVTTLLSVITAFQPHIDNFLAATLNAITLSLSFQTRQMVNGTMNAPEVVVYEGNQDLFPVAMVHGNAIMGFHLTDLPQGNEWLPTWAGDDPTVELNRAALVRTPPAAVADLLPRYGRRRVGALMIVEPQHNWGELAFHRRYAAIADFVGEHTIYALAAGAEVVVACANALQRRYPEGRFDVRLYTRRAGAGVEHRGILIFKGLAGLPEVDFCQQLTRQLHFVEAMPNDGTIHPEVHTLAYASDGAVTVEKRQTPEGTSRIVGHWERASVKRPFHISSSAPLTEEGRRRISDPTEVFHSAGIVEGGTLIASQDSAKAVFVCADDKDRIIMEFGDQYSNLWAAPIWRESVVGDDGVRRTQMRADRIVRVEGAAMPLFFTPTLHQWYSHFLIQCLPRVRIARAAGANVSIIVPEQMRAKQFEMLAALGFDESRVVRVPPGAIVQASRLYMPRAWQLVFTPYTTEIYRELATKFGNMPIATPKRILISRESRKTWRNLLNFETIRRLLVEDYGFVVLAAERLTLAEEIATFANAEIVVGAEGAGMYGAVFARPGAVYITLCDEDYVMPILGTLAEVIGIEIGYVFGEAMRAESDVSRRLEFGHADFVVDIERVEAAVKAAIARVKGEPASFSSAF